MLRFSKIINPLSYLYSILITIGFTLIVNFVTYFALKKIDMIESLKSVEWDTGDRANLFQFSCRKMSKNNIHIVGLYK